MKLLQNRFVRIISHVAFWGFLVGPKYFMEINRSGFGESIGQVLVHFVTVSGITYLNLYWLLKQFLKDNKLFAYLLRFSGLIVVYVGIKLSVVLINDKIEAYSYQQILLTLVYYGAFFVLINLIAVAVKLGKKYFLDRRKMKTMELEKYRTEVNYLRSQISPHFLFNTLNSIYSLTLQKDERAPNVILKLSGMMEYMVYESQEEFVALEKETEFLRSFTELSQLRFEDSVNFNLEIGEIPEGARIAPLLLFNFVENAVKFASAHGGKANNFVDVKIRCNNDHLHFTCSNSYGEQETEETQSGFGIENVRKRLQLIYPEKHKLDIQKKEGEFMVELNLELT